VTGVDLVHIPCGFRREVSLAPSDQVAITCKLFELVFHPLGDMSGHSERNPAASCRVIAFLSGPSIEILEKMAVDGFNPCVGSMVSARRKSFCGTLFGQTALSCLKEPLVAYAKLIDVNFGIPIEGSTIRFTFMPRSEITHGPPIFGF
jgi:hypothetical protein